MRLTHLNRYVYNLFCNTSSLSSPVRSIGCIIAVIQINDTSETLHLKIFSVLVFAINCFCKEERKSMTDCLSVRRFTQQWRRLEVAEEARAKKQ